MAFYMIAMVTGGLTALLTLLGFSPAFFASATFLCFVPFPVIYVSLRYEHWCGLLAAFIATVIIVLTYHSYAALAYLVAFGLPSWLIGYLFLWQPAPSTSPALKQLLKGNTKNERWVPVGTIVAITALLTPVLTGMSISGASSFHDYQTAIQEYSRLLLEAKGPQGEALLGSGSNNIEQNSKLLAQLIPAMAATAWMIIILLNTWAAVRIALTRKDFPRSRPSFFLFSLPRWFNIFFVITFIFSLMDGVIGLMGSVGVVTAILSFGLVGLSVIHLGLQGVRWRRAILCGVYFFLLVQGWAIFLVALLGLVEHYAGLKRRFFLKPEAAPKE